MPKKMPYKLIVYLLILTFPLSGIYANEKTGESVATVKGQAAAGGGSDHATGNREGRYL